jgi:hypothetical protein
MSRGQFGSGAVHRNAGPGAEADGGDADANGTAPDGAEPNGTAPDGRPAAGDRARIVVAPIVMVSDPLIRSSAAMDDAPSGSNTRWWSA